jgi:glyoxylase-like metal-dependent hydrolase (beta-lactamase superfamily II)
MLRIVVSTVALTFGALLTSPLLSPASAQSAADLVKQAVAAQGGADALKKLQTISIKGEAKFWEPGQSHKPGGEPRFLGDANYSANGDFANHTVRIEWDRDQKYPAPEKMKYTETFAQGVGFITDDKGMKPMSGIRLAAQTREIVRSSPTLMLYALEHPADVKSAGVQKLDGRSLPAIALKVGQYDYTVLFDRKTKLPAAIRSKDDDNIAGDSNFDLVLSDWKAVNGVQMAHTKSGRVNGVEVVRYVEKEVSANAPMLASHGTVPDEIKAKAAKGPPSGTNVPYQWVLRRIYLTRFLDSDGVIVPDGGSLKLVELAPNVQHVQGGTANNLIVAMKDHLVIVDAPYGEQQSRWVIDAAKAKYPGKPVKFLVLTHHHMDHTGGMRTYVAEGATVVVPQGSRAVFAKDARAPHTVAPDAQQKAGNKAAKIVEVKDTMAMKDDTMEINLMNIPNPHVDGMIIAHLPASNIVYVTDLISPRGPIGRNPQTVAVGDALRKANITGATIAGGHGTTAKQSEIGQALAAN